MPGMFENPYTSLGLGLLAANTGGRNFSEVLGRGGMLGMQNYQLGQSHAAEMAKSKAAAEAKQQAIAAQQAQANYWQQQGGQLGALGQQYPQIAAQRQAEMLTRAPKQTPLQQNLIAGGLQPGTPEYQNAVLERTKRVPLVNQPINLPETKQITEEAKKVGGYYGDAFIDTQKAETAARASNAKMNRLGQLFENTYTGTGAQTVLSAKKALKMLGADVSGIGEAEAGSALANEMSLELRNPSGGAGMPGSMSDSDRSFLQNMTPGLATTKEGRKLMVETKKKLNQRSMEVAKMARAYRKQNGALDEGFHDVMSAFSSENPLFSEESPEGATEANKDADDVIYWADLPEERSGLRGRNRPR